MMKRVGGGVLVLLCLLLSTAKAADTTSYSAEELYQKMKAKLALVTDYSADVKMKINISYMRVPTLTGKLYYKAPNKMKLDRRGGIAIMPKKGVSFNINSVVPEDDATVIDAGYDEVDGRKLHVIKIIPNNDEGDVILTKIWVDEARLLALKSETTTRENGTVKMELAFDAYEKLALPDKVIFYLDEQEYKLPKGMTMDYEVPDIANSVKNAKGGKRKKGKIEITYLRYEVNKGLKDSLFE